MTAAAAPARPKAPWVASALVLLALLAALLFGLRGLVMSAPEAPAAAHHGPGHAHDAGKTHHHGSHCPLCFLLLLPASLAPAPLERPAPGLAPRLWLGSAQARDEFLRAVAARGPPRA